MYWLFETVIFNSLFLKKIISVIQFTEWPQYWQNASP